jgi:DNA-binding PadR family transcriptional regulator
MRGDVRAGVLALLAEQSRHGYAIMSELTERSGGLWRPSPGSVYPILQQLQDEGLVSVEESEGRRVYSLTERGRTYVEEHREDIGRPWEMADSGRGRRARCLSEGMAALAAAVQQVARLADETQAARATAALEDARRTMYRILAGDEVGAPSAGRESADTVAADDVAAHDEGPPERPCEPGETPE